MSPQEKLHFGKKSLGLWLEITKKHGSLIRAFNPSESHQAYKHYPCDDIISNCRSLQYFYHSHRNSGEHGHIHIFRKNFDTSQTNHLLAIGLSDRGLPVSLFTVNTEIVNEEPIEREALKKLFNKSLKKSQNETLLTSWIIAFCNFYKSEITNLLASDFLSENHSNENDINTCKLINWEEDLELSENNAC